MTVKQIVMPKLGESVTEGTINSWLVKPGDYVQKYDPIAEVMTDKVNAEVPSSHTGVIKDLVVNEGDTVKVEEIICYIETEEADDKGAREENNEASSSNEEYSAKVEQSATASIEHATNKMRYSPAVAKLAAEHHIDLTKVNGTGLGGRITRKDMEKLIAERSERKTAMSQPEPVKPKKQKETEIVEDTITIPVTGVRKATAQKILKSKQEIPHAWMTVEVDVTNLVKYRESIKERFLKQEGFPITYFTFFVYAVAKALKEFPELNSTWQEDHIVQHRNVHISIAVAKEKELFVPVIKHADEKNIKGIAKSIYELAHKVRSGKLTNADVEGGTFTVNNTGTFGSVSSMGIINYPQAAILQVESIVKRPVIIDDMFAARDMVNLCLSLDHRILDGYICGLFLARVKEILQNINEDTVNL